MNSYEVERILNQREIQAEKELEHSRTFNADLFEPVVVCEVLHVLPDADAPSELKDIQAYWKEEADCYGDRGACVLGAGFEFTYNDERYFMPPLSIWQGSVSWEHCKGEIEEKLKELGATHIMYDWGMMD